MSDYRCSACGSPHPGRHYADPCRGDVLLSAVPLSPAVRLVTPPVRDESVLRAFRGQER